MGFSNIIEPHLNPKSYQPWAITSGSEDSCLAFPGFATGRSHPETGEHLEPEEDVTRPESKLAVLMPTATASAAVVVLPVT